MTQSWLYVYYCTNRRFTLFAVLTEWDTQQPILTHVIMIKFMYNIQMSCGKWREESGDANTGHILKTLQNIGTLRDHIIRTTAHSSGKISPHFILQDLSASFMILSSMQKPLSPPSTSLTLYVVTVH